MLSQRFSARIASRGGSAAPTPRTSRGPSPDARQDSSRNKRKNTDVSTLEGLEQSAAAVVAEAAPRKPDAPANKAKSSQEDGDKAADKRKEMQEEMDRFMKEAAQKLLEKYGDDAEEFIEATKSKKAKTTDAEIFDVKKEVSSQKLLLIYF